MNAIPDIVTWAESAGGFYLADTKQPIRLAAHQRAILRHATQQDEAGRFLYQTILYSAPKKSGKTTLAALFTLWYALFVEPAGGEIFLVANDLEQSTGRVFADLVAAVRTNPVMNNRYEVRARQIITDTRATITALASDYAGAAGSRHGLTVWDELWGYTTEGSRRLWDELTPVPTKHNSTRLVVTYAGFEGESNLLEELYKRGLAGEPVAELAHIEDGDGAAACRSAGRLFVYWDHELKPHAGLTMTADAYHEEQRQELRPAAYLRLHENRWASSISAFVSAEDWQACYSADVAPYAPGLGYRMVLGADASMSRDYTALVGAIRAKDGATHVVYCRVWKPTKGGLRGGRPTVDLDQGLKAAILELHEAHAVAAVVFDHHQMHSISLELERAGVRMIDMPQTTARVAADQSLYDAVMGRTIRHFNHPELNQAIANAVAVETPRGFRLAKEKTSRKIDAAVSLSMAAWGVPTYGAYQSLPDRQPTAPSRWNIGQQFEAGSSKWKRY